MPSPVSRRVELDQLKREVIIISSPIRLGRGGRAKLARLARNHHEVISGRAAWSPRARSIVRL